MTNNKSEQEIYERAKKRVEEEKGFYSHLTAYIIINIALLLIHFSINYNFKGWLQWHILITPFLWGIGLLIHGICVFAIRKTPFKNWERRKIKELMDNDDF